MPALGTSHMRLVYLLAMATVGFFSVSIGHAQIIDVQYFRGVCTAGAVGAACNANQDCGMGGVCTLTLSVADDTTLITWSPFGPNPADVYRGPIGPSVPMGTFVAGATVFNAAACFLSDNPFGTSGFLNQTADPNPPLGSLAYYVASMDGGPSGFPNVNAFGCSKPHICNNIGWCEFGLTPGSPCFGSCPGVGGICTVETTHCYQEAGGAGSGGCALHPICAGGPNMDALCHTSNDCPFSTCPLVPPGTVTPGQLCYNAPGAPGAPVGDEGCPVPGDPKRLVRTISAAVIAGCP